MPDAFQYNIFLSHSAKDKAVVRASSLSASTEERAGVRCRSLDSLRADGVKVWFDEWVLQPVLPLAHQMGEGARRSGEGCLSEHAFGSDWAQLESGTLRTGQRPFRGPLNKDRHFLPLRLDDGTLKEHFHRFEFVPTMLRIGCMNRLPHGVENPVITHRNSLAQEAKA